MPTYSKAQLEQIWRMENPGVGNPHLMAAIALAESAGRSDNINSIGACGLWQIHPYEAGCVSPALNARMAGQKLQTQGLGAWESYTNGSYAQFLSGGTTKNAGYTELIPGERGIPLIGPLGEKIQKLGEETGKAGEEGIEEGLETLPGVGGVIKGAGGLQTLQKILELITSKDGIIRIGKVLVGLFLFLSGVLNMANSNNPVTVNAIQQTSKKAKNLVVSRGL